MMNGKWSDEQLNEYKNNGYYLAKRLLNKQEIDLLNEAIPEILYDEQKYAKIHRVKEWSGAIRSAFLAHRYVEAYREIIRNPKILIPVQQILDSDVYVWHSKINVKDALEGTVWLWHQDYGYWLWDGAEKPRLISVMIILDKATLNNGCLMAVAKSHKLGRQEHYLDEKTTSYKQWCLNTDFLKENVKDEDIIHVTGEPGDAFFFDCNIIHGSGHNMSPLSRNTFIIAYNAIDNIPLNVENPRPDWVVSKIHETVK